MKNFYKTSIICITLLLISFVFSGCGAGGSSYQQDQTGVYSLSIAWPDGSISGESKVIPSGSQTVTVSITGDNLSSPITASASYSQTNITISNIPYGHKVALIKALDSSSNIKAQRKEAFMIWGGGQTVTADHVPLGIAITGTDSAPVFEPTSIQVTYGTKIYFQNWLDQAETCTVTQNAGYSNNISMAAVSTDSNGTAVFSESSFTPAETYKLSISGSSAACKAYSPITNYAFSTIWTGTHFHTPVMACVDKNGYVYVSNNNSPNFLKLDSSGNLVTTIGKSGTGDGEFTNPWGIAVDQNGNILVTDCTNANVQRFSSTGTFLTRFGSYGTSGNAKFNHPTGITVGPSGEIYVCDSWNSRVQKFYSDGTFCSIFLSGASNSPYGVNVDSQGSIYVSTYDRKIEKYLSNGSFSTSWYGPNSGSFATMSIDSSDNIYVMQFDTSNVYDRCIKYNSVGSLITQWGSYGHDQGQFHLPHGVAVAPDGSVIVADLSNNRLQKFVPSL